MEPVASIFADAQATSSTLPFDATPEGILIAHVQDPALTRHILSLATHAHTSTPAALVDQVPPTPPRTVTAPLEPLTPLYPSTAAASSKDDSSVTGNIKTQTKTGRQPAKRKNGQVDQHHVHYPGNLLPKARRSSCRMMRRTARPEAYLSPGRCYILLLLFVLLTLASLSQHKSSASTADAVADRSSQHPRKQSIKVSGMQTPG